MTIDVHGSLDRAKDVSSNDGRARFFASCRAECVRLAHADDVPLLAFQRTPAVAGAPARRGRDPLRTMTDRPRPTFFRHPAKAAGVR